VFLLSGSVAGACAGSDNARLRADLDALRAQQAQLAAELAELKTRVPPPSGAMSSGEVRTLTVAGRPTRGADTATVTFIEYSDYGCPYCAQYTREVYPRLMRDYVETGTLRYVFKSYPVEELHPGAFAAHVAAACAGDQGRYWDMHGRLFTDQANFRPPRFVEDARQLGLDRAAFETCLAGSAHEAVIRQDIDEAVRGGVNGTPVFVIALTEPNQGAVTPRRVVVGVQPFEAFKDAIDAALATAGVGRKEE
jgi:protein-disulfide isomerase